MTTFEKYMGRDCERKVIIDASETGVSLDVDGENGGARPIMLTAKQARELARRIVDAAKLVK